MAGNDSFSSILNITIVWQCKDTDARVGAVAANVKFLIAKHAAELALMVNNASYQGDLLQLKHLIKEGAAVVRADYDGRTPLVRMSPFIPVDEFHSDVEAYAFRDFSNDHGFFEHLLW